MFTLVSGITDQFVVVKKLLNLLPLADAKSLRAKINIVRMAGLLKVDTGTVHDDFAALRVVSDAKASLQVLHGKGALSDYPHIKVLFETFKQ